MNETFNERYTRIPVFQNVKSVMLLMNFTFYPGHLELAVTSPDGPPTSKN